MRLEPELWDALEEICRREALGVRDLVRRVETQGVAGGRTSAMRVFILKYFRAGVTDMGHANVRHGQPSGLPYPC
jgi:predicted DNA-binding ribbon-helix-helix protein